MSKTTLYSIAEEYNEILDSFESLEEGELDDVTLERLDKVEHSLTEKATNIAAYIRNQQVLTEAIKKAEDTMRKRRKIIEGRIDWLRRYLLENMEKTDITKIECPWFKIGIRKNPESLVVTDLLDLPDDTVILNIEMSREDFLRAQFSLTGINYLVKDATADKKAIREKLHAGEKIKGAFLEQKKRVQIS